MSVERRLQTASNLLIFATTLEEIQLDYYKLNKILQVYGLNVRVAFIDNFTKLPYFELH